MSDIGIKWPADFAGLHSTAVPGSMLDQLAVEAEGLADCPNFWVPIVYQPGKGLAFHFDKDEHAMKERHEMVQPILSSVLYLTGDAAVDRSGPTVILDQHYDSQQGKAVPDSPSRTALIYPVKNNYVLFDGRLGHGVLESASSQPRMTMLINWWADKPQGIEQITQEAIKQHSLGSLAEPPNQSCNGKATLSSSAAETPPQTLADQSHQILAEQSHQNLAEQLQQTGISASAADASSQKMAVEHEDALNQHVIGNHRHAQTVPPADHLNAASEHSITGDSCQDGSHDSTHGLLDTAASSQRDKSQHKAQDAPAKRCRAAQPKQLKVPAISIQGWDEAPVTVDDVLATYRIQLTGPSAIHAVAIDHTGFELFPLDEENIEANGGSIMTAAAFVPCGAFSSSEDSSDSDNDA